MGMPCKLASTPHAPADRCLAPRSAALAQAARFVAARLLAAVVAFAIPGPLAAQVPAMSAIEEAMTGSPSIVAANPPRSELQRALAAKNYERAERLLADAIARQPASRELLMQIAGVFMLDRKPLNAAIALKKAEALGPLDNQSRLQLALAYIAMQRRDWARPELQKLALAEPANVVHTYWLARLDYDEGQYASAIARLKDVVARAPEFARAHDNLGLCYEALHEPDAAIPHYREAVRLNREAHANPSGWPALNLAILLRSRGELDEAERLVREALTYDRRLAPAHYQLGAVLEERGRLDDAVKALRQAAEADSSYPAPYYALSRIYRQQGRTADAEAAMKTFRTLKETSRERGR
jgi:tetratricopeptide (TPR) repeat protein